MLIEQSGGIDNLHEEALELYEKARILNEKELASSLQEGVDLEVLREQQIEKTEASLTPTEKKREMVAEKETVPGKAFYFSPCDEFNSDHHIQFLKDNRLRIQKQAEENLRGKNFESHESYLEQLEQEIEKLKYFPVMFISAPHLPPGHIGSFGGEPTPLLYAIAELEQRVRTDTFEAERSPDIVAVHNPTHFTDEFLRDVVRDVKHKQPRVVGISNTSEGHFYAMEIARVIKQHSPETIVILGGAHEDGTNPEVYFRPDFEDRQKIEHGGIDVINPEYKKAFEQFATISGNKKDSPVDIVVAGDGQYALVELLKFVANNPGKTTAEIIKEMINKKDGFKSVIGDGNIFFNDRESGNDLEQSTIVSAELSGNVLDWSKLPYMYRGRLASENRFSVFGDKKTAQVMANMHCMHNCYFCSESGGLYELKGRAKPRTAKNVINEIEILLKDYGYEAIFFDDSTFTQFNSKLNELLDEIIKLGQGEQGTKFEWGCQTAFDNIPNQEIIKKMKEAGCTYIYFGFEQIERDIPGRGAKKLVLKQAWHGAVTREEKIKHIETILDWCKKEGIRVGTSLQFGLKQEEKYQETIDVVADLYKRGLIMKHGVALNINSPIPGSQQFTDVMIDKAAGRLVKEPDYKQQLQRHELFESGHQFSSLELDKMEEIALYATEKLGDAVIGIEFDDPVVSAKMRETKRKFAADRYFSENYRAYIEGRFEATHLNHASISNRPGELESIRNEYKELSPSEREKIFQTARDNAAELVGVSPKAVIFGRNTTEAVKLMSWLANLQKGDGVMVTDAENPSITRAFQFNMDHGNPEGRDGWSTFPTFYSQDYKKRNAKPYETEKAYQTGVEVQEISVVNETSVEAIKANIESNLKPNTKCFVMSHVVRDTGKELPVKEIIALVREKKKQLNPSDPEIFVIIDGAQALGNLPQVNFADLDCDGYVGTPHKTMGSTPIGLGFLNLASARVKNNLSRLKELKPNEQLILDNMFHPELGVKLNVNDIHTEEAGQPLDTIHPVDAFGFNRAVGQLKAMGYQEGNFEKIAELRKTTKQCFRESLQWIAKKQKYKIIEIEDGTPFIYSFTVLGINNRWFQELLAKSGIFVSYIDRAKLSGVEKKDGNGVIRVSFSS